MNEYLASRTVTDGEATSVFIGGASYVRVEEFAPDGTHLQTASATGGYAAVLVAPPVVGNTLYVAVTADGEVAFPAGWKVEYP